jgi:NAD(P)-dependent dehydrogenase (short-subunit alcohol dehydrogenase family)
MSFVELSEEQLLRAMNEKFLFYTRTLRLAWDKVGQSVTWLTGAAARSALPGISNYAASNGALHAIMDRSRWSSCRCASSASPPGLVRTNFWRNLGMPAEAQAAMYAGAEQSIPLRHVAEPDEIAHALLFAATNSYTTGTILDPDGGLHLGTVGAVQTEKCSFGNVR